MSEEKVIKMKFQGKEISCSINPSYDQFFSLFKKEFSIDDEKMKKMTFNYLDNENDKNCLENEDDFIAFFNLITENEIIVEGEIDENKNPQETELKNKPEDKNLDSSVPILNSLYPTEINNKEKESEEINKENIQMSQIINTEEKLPVVEEKIANDEKIKKPIISDKEVEENKKINDNIIEQNNNNNESNKIDDDIKNNEKKENNKEIISSVKNEEEDNKKEKEKNIQNNSKTNYIKDNEIINEKNKEEMIMDNKEKKNPYIVNNKDKSSDNNKNNKDDNNTNNINNNKNINCNNELRNINNNNDNKKRSEKNLILLISILINILAFLFYVFKNKFGKNTNQIIIGIDFGSTFSGYSIIINSNIDFEDSDLNKVIPSELILDKETKIGLRIGKLAQIFPKGRVEIENKLYFCKFKRNLEPKNNSNYVGSDIPLGQQIELEYVIKGFLSLLREEIQNNPKIMNININDIKWIISVPPLWDEKGKKFMKDVAYKSGMIHSEIALEPESASLSIFHDKSIKKKFLKKGKTFLIVDAGGYTVDISANKIIDDYDNLEQLLKPTSVVLGSNIINERIIEIIQAIYSKEKLDEMKKSNYEAWERILVNIEEKKKQIDYNTAENFKISGKFLKGNCRIMNDNCKSTYNGTEITYSSNEIDIPGKIIINIISEIANNIVNQINKCFSKTNENIDLIVLTGGFSNCKIFQNEVRKNFRGSLKEILFLNSPQETVMRGSAIFGLRPNQILYRISPVTIAVNSYKIINENDECVITDRDENGNLVCLKYKIFVERAKSIKTNQVFEHIIKPINETVNIYSSFDDEINENDKNILDSLEIPTSALPLQNRTIIVSMRFSNYINVSVTDNESKKTNWKIIYYPS